MKILKLNELDSLSKKKVEPCLNIFENVLPYVRVEEFEVNENIVYFDKPIQYVRYLISGKAKISLIHEDGKRTIIDFIGPSEFIGELSFLEIEAHPKDVVALSTCLCLSVPLDLTKSSLMSDANFLLNLSRYIGTKLLKRTWFNTKNQNYELKNRLAAYILMSESEGIYKEKHTETAEFLGVSYRHLLYTLKVFQDEQLIVKQKKGYKVNFEALKALSRDIK